MTGRQNKQFINISLPDDQTCPAYLSTVDSYQTGIIFLHDCWGLSQHSIEIADNFADAGYAVLLPNLYRTAPPTHQQQADGMMDELEWEWAATSVVAGARRFLREDCDKVVLLGLSMGSGIGLLAAAVHDDIDSYACFYGLPDLSKLKTENINSPVQGHFIAADELDEWCPASRVKDYLTMMEASQKPIDMHWYEGARHGFMNHSKPEMYCADTCQLATKRTLDFFQST